MYTKQGQSPATGRNNKSGGTYVEREETIFVVVEVEGKSGINEDDDDSPLFTELGVSLASFGTTCTGEDDNSFSLS